MTTHARAAILVCAALGALTEFGGVAGAQQAPPRPTPLPAPCARPNIMPFIIRSVPGIAPPMAVQQGIQGTVFVVVSLDADSHVVGTRIQSSPSPILNAAALSAARNSTFQTEVRDCRPIAGDYIFTVDFLNDATFATTSSGERTVSVVGEGSTSRAPDVAYVMTRIVTYDGTATGASTKNDAIFTALKAKVAPLVVRDGGIHGTPVPLLGETAGPYTAVRPVEIEVSTVANAVHVAAAAAALASVHVSGIRYELTDDAAAYREAMSIARTYAENSAQAAARTQHLWLGALKQVSAPPPSDSARHPSVYVPFNLVPVAGGFKEPDIRVPLIDVRATATVTYVMTAK